MSDPKPSQTEAGNSSVIKTDIENILEVNRKMNPDNNIITGQDTNPKSASTVMEDMLKIKRKLYSEDDQLVIRGTKPKLDDGVLNKLRGIEILRGAPTTASRKPRRRPKTSPDNKNAHLQRFPKLPENNDNKNTKSKSSGSNKSSGSPSPTGSNKSAQKNKPQKSPAAPLVRVAKAPTNGSHFQWRTKNNKHSPTSSSNPATFENPKPRKRASSAGVVRYVPVSPTLKSQKSPKICPKSPENHQNSPENHSKMAPDTSPRLRSSSRVSYQWRRKSTEDIDLEGLSVEGDGRRQSSKKDAEKQTQKKTTEHAQSSNSKKKKKKQKHKKKKPEIAPHQRAGVPLCTCGSASPTSDSLALPESVRRRLCTCGASRHGSPVPSSPEQSPANSNPVILEIRSPASSNASTPRNSSKTSAKKPKKKTDAAHQSSPRKSNAVHLVEVDRAEQRKDGRMSSTTNLDAANIQATEIMAQSMGYPPDVPYLKLLVSNVPPDCTARELCEFFKKSLKLARLHCNNWMVFPNVPCAHITLPRAFVLRAMSLTGRYLRECVIRIQPQPYADSEEFREALRSQQRVMSPGRFDGPPDHHGFPGPPGMGRPYPSFSGHSGGPRHSENFFRPPSPEFDAPFNGPPHGPPGPHFGQNMGPPPMQRGRRPITPPPHFRPRRHRSEMLRGPPGPGGMSPPYFGDGTPPHYGGGPPPYNGDGPPPPWARMQQRMSHGTPMGRPSSRRMFSPRGDFPPPSRSQSYSVGGAHRPMPPMRPSFATPSVSSAASSTGSTSREAAKIRKAMKSAFAEKKEEADQEEVSVADSEESKKTDAEAKADGGAPWERFNERRTVEGKAPSLPASLRAPITASMVDSCAHLSGEEFWDDAAEVIERALNHGVGHILVAGESISTGRESIKLSARYPDVLSCCVGVHPDHIGECDNKTIPTLAKLCRYKYVRAIGPIGLNYTKPQATRFNQFNWFEQQVLLGCNTRKPLVVVDMNATKHVLRVLDQHMTQIPPVIIHAFSGSKDDLKRYVKRGFFISFDGTIGQVLNFKRLAELVAYVPLNRLLVESNAPFSTPDIDQRVKRFAGRNEPCTMRVTVRVLAEAYGVPADRLAYQTAINACRVFRLGLMPRPPMNHVKEAGKNVTVSGYKVIPKITRPMTPDGPPSSGTTPRASFNGTLPSLEGSKAASYEPHELATVDEKKPFEAEEKKEVEKPIGEDNRRKSFKSDGFLSPSHPPRKLDIVVESPAVAVPKFHARRTSDIPTTSALVKPHTKVITFIVHGESQDAEAAVMNGNVELLSWNWEDARLTVRGHQQCKELCPTFQSMKFDLILASTLMRALDSASVVFRHYRFRVPFLASELLRERFGKLPCDKRSNLRLLEDRFPHIDFNLVDKNEDPLWTLRREPESSIIKRCEDFLEFIFSRKEKVIAVVGHQSFFNVLVTKVIKMDNSEKYIPHGLEHCKFQHLIVTPIDECDEKSSD